MKDLNVTAAGTELLFREGKAPEVFNPEPLRVDGTLDAPLRYLQKRVDMSSERRLVSGVEQSRCSIIVNRENMSVKLAVNDRDHFADIIMGSLQLHPDFVKLGINSGKYRTPLEMAEFINMNKAFFENRNEASDLVVQLRKFKAKVDKQVEAEFNPNKGDKKAVMQQAVDTNLPPTFKVCIPIFKGCDKETLEVETYFNPDDLTCTLICADANEKAHDYKNNAIDKILCEIKEIAPGIAIMEV